MRPGELLQVGDEATTAYRGEARRVTVRIVARRDEQRSQSGVTFQVAPPLDKYDAGAWCDAHWFAPVTS